MRLRIDVELTAEEAEKYWTESIKDGFMRVEPRKRWSASEKREAIRYHILKLIATDLECIHDPDRDDV